MKIKNSKQLGLVAKHVRQAQSIDQLTAGLLSGNGITFISQFENGKETVEIGRVFQLLDQLGINIELDLPPDLSEQVVKKIENSVDAKLVLNKQVL